MLTLAEPLLHGPAEQVAGRLLAHRLKIYGAVCVCGDAPVPPPEQDMRVAMCCGKGARLSTAGHLAIGHGR